MCTVAALLTVVAAGAIDPEPDPANKINIKFEGVYAITRDSEKTKKNKTAATVRELQDTPDLAPVVTNYTLPFALRCSEDNQAVCSLPVAVNGAPGTKVHRCVTAVLKIRG